MAHALYLRGEYGRSLGMAENALIMKQGSYPISELFLHLAASMACMSLKDIDTAKTHFGVAWNIARPDGLIELIGEHHGLLQGLIEACLKRNTLTTSRASSRLRIDSATAGGASTTPIRARTWPTI